MSDRQEDRLNKIETRVETMFWCMHHLVGHEVFMSAIRQVVGDKFDELTEKEFDNIVGGLDLDDTADQEHTDD